MKTKNYPNEYIFRYSDAQKEQIEDFRYANRIPTASVAFRKLLELGLEAAANRELPRLADPRSKDAAAQQAKREAV